MSTIKIEETGQFEDVYLTSFTEALTKLGETELLEAIQDMPPRLREATVKKQVAVLTEKVYKLRKSIAESLNAIKNDHSAEANEIRPELVSLKKDADEAYMILENENFIRWAQEKSEKSGFFNKMKNAFFNKKAKPEEEKPEENEAKKNPNAPADGTNKTESKEGKE